MTTEAAVAWICNYSVIMVPIFSLRALVLEGNESRLSEQWNGLQKGICNHLEYEMSLSAPCFQLSTTAEYYTLLFLFTFPVMFTQEVNFLYWIRFLLNRDALLPCWHVLWCHLFCLFHCLFLPSPQLFSILFLWVWEWWPSRGWRAASTLPWMARACSTAR